eukprot:gene9646-17407_t
MIHSKSVPWFQSPTIPINRSHSESEWKDTWKSAVLKAKERKDPWEEYNIPDSCDVERAYRYRYSALEKKWVRDEIEVKMQTESKFILAYLQFIAHNLDRLTPFNLLFPNEMPLLHQLEQEVSRLIKDIYAEFMNVEYVTVADPELIPLTKFYIEVMATNILPSIIADLGEKHTDEAFFKYKVSHQASCPIETVKVMIALHRRMEMKSFARGAMRKCFRTKKLSKFSHSNDWNNASNYVAKQYIEEVAKKVYFDDVKIQMDAKVWAEEYNRKDPPKKVDIFQVYIVELYQRENRPLFHFEHFIEGKYVKYNSNSGYVLADLNFRMTPQDMDQFPIQFFRHLSYEQLNLCAWTIAKSSAHVRTLCPL